MTDKQKQKRSEEKSEVQNQINKLRNRKYEINKILDSLYSNNPDPKLTKGQNPISLTNELVSINKKVSDLRDRLDEINAKLHRVTSYTLWQ